MPWPLQGQTAALLALPAGHAGGSSVSVPVGILEPGTEEA